MKNLKLPPLPFPESVTTSLEDVWNVTTEKVEDLSGDARAMAARVEKQVRSATGRLNLEMDKARRDATRLANDLSRKVGGTVESFVSKALHRINVPTRRELKDLTMKVDVLGRKIDSLRAARRVRRPMKRTRRAA